MCVCVCVCVIHCRGRLLVTQPVFSLRSELKAQSDLRIGHYTPGQRGHNPSSYIPYLLAAVWVNRG